MDKITILGGGASGVFSAILLARKFGGENITIIEGSDRLLKKVSMSGNGQGNLSNIKVDNEEVDYYVGGRQLARTVLQNFSREQTLEVFSSIGLQTTILENGRIYPKSFQASSITDLLRFELQRLGVNIKLNDVVSSIRKTKGFFEITSSSGKTRTLNVIYALGGASYPKLLTKESNFDMLKDLTHTIMPLMPALVQLKVDNDSIKPMKGIKFDVNLSVLQNGKIVQSYQDEIHFADKAISGPATFFLSPFATNYIERNGECNLQVDFFPAQSLGELMEVLMERVENMPHLTAEQLFLSILPTQIARGILKESRISPLTPFEELSDNQIIAIARIAKGLKLTATSTYGFNFAQATLGGVKWSQIDPNTLMSRIVPNLYVIGESLEPCGLCGGFNLQFAWSSAGTLAKNFKL